MRFSRSIGVIGMVLLTTLFFTSCDPQGRRSKPKADAVVVLAPTSGNTASGVVTFSIVKNGVRIIADIEGLSPGAHGVHIHEYGDCRAGDGSSAGGHFNPLKKAHGAPDAEERHLGDLGNVVADEQGGASLDVVDPVIALTGEHSIVGRSVVVHSGEDDFQTQPHGGAGKRIACGTIGVAAR